jgi:hypothetical protein
MMTTLERTNSLTGIRGVGLKPHHSGGNVRLYATMRDPNVSRSITKHGLRSIAKEFASLMKKHHKDAHIEDMAIEIQEGLQIAVHRMSENGPPASQQPRAKEAAQDFVERYLENSEDEQEFDFLLIKNGEVVGAQGVQRVLAYENQSLKGAAKKPLSPWQSQIISLAEAGADRKLWVSTWAEAHSIPFEECEYEKLLRLFRRDEEVRRVIDFLNLYIV